MALDFVFDSYEEKAENGQTDIEFICSFDGPIPSKKDVIDNLALYFNFQPDCARMERFRPVGGKRQVRGRITIRR
jgi:ribosomal protein S24E